MKVSVVCCTYGDPLWAQRGRCALHTADGQGAHEAFTLHLDNAVGYADVRNSAAASATGDWLCFLDADDELAPGYLAAIRAVHGTRWDADCDGLYVPTAEYLTPEGTRVRAPHFPNGGGSRPLSDVNWAVVGTLVPRQLFHDVGGFRQQDFPYEDWSLWLRCVIAGACLVPVPNAVYRVFELPESASRTSDPARQASIVETYSRIRGELRRPYLRARRL